MTSNITKIATVFFVALIPTASAAQWWNPFAPADYEDCTESAANNAKSKAALDILVSACERKFSGRRKSGGGYTYFDARQGKQYNIAGPNPTAAELKKIDDEYSRYLVEQREFERLAAERQAQEKAAEERREQARIDWELRKREMASDWQKRQESAATKIKITSSKIECSYCKSARNREPEERHRHALERQSYKGSYADRIGRSERRGTFYS